MFGGRVFQRALQDGAHKSHPGGIRHYRGFRPDWWKRKETGLFRAVERALDSGAYRGVGEVRLKHRGCGAGVPEMKCDYDFEPDHRIILRLFEICAIRRIPVVVHLEVDEDSRGRLAAFSRALSAVPKACVIWAHAGPCAATALRRMLERHPNLYAEIQPLIRNTYASQVPMLRTFPALVSAEGRLLPEWRSIFEKFADRLMFGSDCRTPAEYAHLRVRAEDMRSILAQIDPGASRFIAYATAERMFATPNAVAASRKCCRFAA
jgi:hypothetical protein